MGSEKEIPIWEKAMLTIPEAAKYSNIGIGRLRKLVKEGEYPFVVHVGKKTLLKRAEYEKFLKSVKEL